MRNQTGISTVTGTVLLCALVCAAFTANALETTVQVGSAYTDPGATAQDNYDGDVTARIVTANVVNVTRVGTYTVTYTVNDTSGNAATPATRSVRVVDTTKPVITLKGNATVTLKKGTTYTDAGATAQDNYDGDVSARMVVTGVVNTAVVGTYVLTYNVSDASGNAATAVVRTVKVEELADTTKPVITLNGSATVTVNKGSAYVDAGATAQDDRDGDITARIVVTNAVNTAVVGSYSVTYSVSDTAGNAATPVVRTVKVQEPADTTKPVITLNGSATVTVNKGSAYTDAGATAQDDRDGDITTRIVVTNAVNTAVVGSYSVTYNVSDTAGNAATPIVRSVTVTSAADTTKPVITLKGSSSIKTKFGRAYVDEGATASDDVDGDITSKIVVTSNVNVWWPGTYTVKYDVSDAAGNAAPTVARTVKVTFFTKTEDESNELLMASPLDHSTYFVSAGAASAPLTLTASAPTGAASVEYTLDGVQVGSATEAPYAVVADLDVTALGWGEHHVMATAKFTNTQETVSAEATFSLAPVAQSDDANGNGIPDNPFATLALEGDVWMHTVPVADTGKNKVVSMARFEGVNPEDAADTPVVLLLDNADDPSRSVTVTVPRDLLGADETGMVMVAAAGDLQTLFGAEEASLLLPEPEGYALANGGFYVEVNVLTSKDGGETFDEVDEAKLAARPVHVVLQGVQPTPGNEVSVHKHPMFVDSDSMTGVTVIAQEGEWSSANVQNLTVESDVLSAELTLLSVFAPYEKTGDSVSNTGCVGGGLNDRLSRGKTGDILLMASAILALMVAGRRKAAPSVREKRSI